jgi:hypothetical protein
LLLLDEPTSALDAASSSWVEAGAHAHFTCFTSTYLTSALDAASSSWVEAGAQSHFTCFTSTNVQILTLLVDGNGDVRFTSTNVQILTLLVDLLY